MTSCLFHGLTKFLLRQVDSIKESNSAASSRFIVRANGSLFADVLRNISPVAMRHILEIESSLENLPAGGQNRYTRMSSPPLCDSAACLRFRGLGVPCPHKVAYFKYNNLALPLGQLNEFWHWNLLVEAAHVGGFAADQDSDHPDCKEAIITETMGHSRCS